MNKFLLFSFLFILFLINGQTSERSLSSEKWQFRNAKDNTWRSAKVPGTVHLDLMNNKIIPDPHKDENEKKVQWVENEDWDYQTQFMISSEELKNQNMDLVFEGLDTFCEIYLNGKLLYSTDNMFRKWTIPVKKQIRKGENILQIKFKSAVNVGKDLARNVRFILPESPRSLVRKAQYQFGWDWGPRLVTAGIWKEVKLSFWNQAKIENMKIEQKAITGKQADLQISAEIFAGKPGQYHLLINGKNKEIILKPGSNRISVPYQILNPKLWQPNGWGDPNLYTIKIVLQKESQPIAEKTERIGLRTIELIQEKDAQGKSFYFKINGQPMYAKGSNWIPGDSFSPRMTKEKYRQLIKDCKEANMNMIRVWGGGIYEDDEFYKACDENGILVWQDFMFAGSFYPADEAFQKNVELEIKDQIDRLQNHPSVAVWCGNNEIDEAIVNWGYQKQFHYSKDDSVQVWKDYKTIFHEVIPNAIKKYAAADKQIYWPSSPSIGWGHKESLTEGDSHYWGVWWGEQPFEIYHEKVPRFASEYGFQGMATMETTKSMFSGTPDLSLQSATIKAHEKHARGWEIIDNYMKRDYVLPKDFVKYNYVSQLLQARGMQIAIEAHRRAKPYNMGTLYWQLNDCWPVVSWSSIDDLGNWKALHYQIKRSFEEVVILVEEKEKTYDIYAINDALTGFDGALQVELLSCKGQSLWALDAAVHLSANSSQKHIVIEKSDLAEFDLSASVLKLSFDSSAKKVENLFYFSRPKDLRLSKPAIRIKKISATEIEISTDVLAKNVYLMGDTHFSDNFFDLLPNTSKRMVLSKPLEKVGVMSLWDTMNP